MNIDSSRIIIVSGMPRAGTSIITYCLACHKDITLYVDGTESHVLENTLLPKWKRTKQNIELLNKILQKTKTKYLLLKRPMNCINLNYLQQDFTDSYYVLMKRKLKDISVSWKESKMVSKKIYTNPQKSYNNFINALQSFKHKQKIIYNIEEAINQPDIFFNKITASLQLDTNFNYSALKENGKWSRKYVQALINKQKILLSATNKTQTGLKNYKLNKNIII